MARITESAKSSLDRRSFEAIGDCSAIIFDGIHNERRWRPLGEGRGLPNEDDIVTGVCERSIKDITGEFKRDESWAHNLRTQRVMTGRVRSLPLLRAITYW